MCGGGCWRYLLAGGSAAEGGGLLGRRGWEEGGLNGKTGAGIGLGSAVFVLRAVGRSSSKRVWRELAASGRFYRALPARGQWREALRSEWGPPDFLIFFRSEVISGCPGELDAVLCECRSGSVTYECCQVAQRLETGFPPCRTV